MKTTIVGSQFHAGAIAALSRLKKGTPLRLVRDSGNAYDKNAVAVYADQQHLGFVPRADNVELARAIDARRRFAVRLADQAVIDGGKVVFAPKIEIREA